MDYSQFLAMKQEISLLVVFLLVFLNDTFLPRRSQGSLGWITCVLFALVTAFGFCPTVNAVTESAFAGMYVTTPAVAMIKNILNIGVLIVMIQSLKWAAPKCSSCAAESSMSFCS